MFTIDFEIIEENIFGHFIFIKNNITKRQVVGILPCYIKKEVKQISGREYWWVPKTLMSARDEIPSTVSRTNRWKHLQMSEQDLNIQPEVSRSS